MIPQALAIYAVRPTKASLIQALHDIDSIFYNTLSTFIIIIILQYKWKMVSVDWTGSECHVKILQHFSDNMTLAS